MDMPLLLIGDEDYDDTPRPGELRIHAVPNGGVVVLSMELDDGSEGMQTALPPNAALELCCQLIGAIYRARGWAAE